MNNESVYRQAGTGTGINRANLRRHSYDSAQPRSLSHPSSIVEDSSLCERNDDRAQYKSVNFAFSDRSVCEETLKVPKVKSADNSKVENIKVIKPKLLLWKFSVYPISLKHGFSSASVTNLCEQIEGVLKRNHTDFIMNKECNGYDCERTVSSCRIRYQVLIHELQAPCQKEYQAKYVIELNRVSNIPCPSLWSSLTCQFFAGLNGLVKERVLDRADNCKDVRGIRREQLSTPDITLTNIKRSSTESLWPCCMDMLTPDKIGSTSVQILELLATSSEYNASKKNEDYLRDGDIERLISLINHDDRDVSRCACTILGNFADCAVFKRIPEAKLNRIFQALVTKLSFIFSTEDVLSLELQREALRALVAVSEHYKPNSFSLTLSKNILQRYAECSDMKLSKLASRGVQIL